MHIFSDESGGYSDHSFLVTSVFIDPKEAERVIRKFRKKEKIKANEVHGHTLSDDQIGKFLQLLGTHKSGTFVSVACRRSSMTGGQIMGAIRDNKLQEHELRTELLLHSLAMMKEQVRGYVQKSQTIGITQDNGRYPKNQLNEAKEVIIDQLPGVIGKGQYRLQYGESYHHPGIQIADVIRNAVYRYLKQVADPQNGSLNLSPELGDLIQFDLNPPLERIVLDWP